MVFHYQEMYCQILCSPTPTLGINPNDKAFKNLYSNKYFLISAHILSIVAAATKRGFTAEPIPNVLYII